MSKWCNPDYEDNEEPICISCRWYQYPCQCKLPYCGEVKETEICLGYMDLEEDDEE